MNWRVGSWIAFLVLVGTILVMAITHTLFASHPSLIAIQVLAFIMMVWARFHLGSRSFHAGADPTQGGLITTGPFRFVRHPIYAAIFYFLTASLVSHASLQNGLLVLVACGCIAVRIAAEESLLIGVYPEYSAYAARVKRIVPLIL